MCHSSSSWATTGMLNRASWDERVPAHAASPGYRVSAFADRSVVPQRGRPVRRTAARRHLRAARGPPAVPHRHRHGLARAARGADDAGSTSRRRRSSRRRGSPTGSGASVDFHEADVYDAVEVLGAGVVRPGLHRDRRAVLAAEHRALGGHRSPDCSSPGGRLFIREGHPMLWALADSRPEGLLVLELPVLRDRGADGLGRGRARTSRPTSSSAQRHPRVEPRPRRDHHRADGRGHGVRPLRRARQRRRGTPLPGLMTEDADQASGG